MEDRRRRGTGAPAAARPAPPRHAPGTTVWDADPDVLMPREDAPGPSAPRPRPDPRWDGGATKGHAHLRVPTALDRLEHWLGLKDRPEEAANARPRPCAPQPPRTAQAGSMAQTTPQAAGTSPAVDVLVHTVAPNDSLEAIALQYGADVRVLRRSNRLWPGDVAQMREQLYIPVESCKWKPANADIQLLQRHADGSLHPMAQTQTGAPPGPGAPAHGTRNATTSPRPHPVPTVECQRVDRDALGFFGHVLPATHEDMGESGVDDLLRLQQRRREGHDVPLPPRAPPEPKARMLQQPDDAWRPNVWTFHTQKERPRTPSAYAGRAPERETLFDVADPEPPLHFAPEPALRLDELLKGPPSNPGAAANWVRPIHWGESLPARPGTHSERDARMPDWLSDVASVRSRMEDWLGSALHELRQVSLGRSTRSAGANLSLPR